MLRKKKTTITQQAIEQRAEEILERDPKERSRWAERKLAERIAYYELQAEEAERKRAH